jgi:xanthine dehydrogenase molybdopterin binding subunit/xanthine dehydrogenase small subunit
MPSRMAEAFEFRLNGRSVRVERCSPNTTLLEYLRDSGLTGSKEGCAEGDCGACSVAIIDRDSHGKPCYRAINSCLVPIACMAGREVVTVEGIANRGRLHSVQQKMVECHGSQCGYCTPGIIVSLLEGFYRDDLKEDWQLDDQLCGNLCRCTGYRSIHEAAIEAFSERELNITHDDGFELAENLKANAGTVEPANYKAAAEIFVRPDTLAKLLQLMQDLPDARLISGATELGLDITKKFKRFPALISLEAVRELRTIESTPNEWRIGGAVTLTQCEEALGAEYPALADMLRVFGSRQIRNRATMGGNLVTASPIGDCAPVLLALDAELVLASLQGERRIPLEQFFVAYRKTALKPGEVLKTIIVPRGPSAPGLTRTCAWYKVSKRREMDISTVAACFRVVLDSAGSVRHARFAYGGVAAMPVRARKAEQALIGRKWDARIVAALLAILRKEFVPITDVRGSALYRHELVTSLFEKFCFEEASRPAATTFSKSKIKNQKSKITPAPHESAHKHVTGEALYTDDQTATRGMLEVWPVTSPHARARIESRDATQARHMPGVHAVLLAEDIPGRNDVGVEKRDEVLLANREVLFHGHPVALVVGESLAACRAAAEKVVVKYAPLPPVLTLEQAIRQRSFHNEPNFIRRGDADIALRSAPMRLAGDFEIGGQEHFYLETQAAWAEPGEDGTMKVVSSTQHPSEVQRVVAHVLDLPSNKVAVECPRMGGGFGGKETQAATPAALAALAAHATGRRVRVRFDRDQDMIITGHRHPFLARFEAGFDEQGILSAVNAQLYSNGGWSLDLSQAVTDRALFHLDNSYYIPNVEFRGQVAKTNLSSNTAFRGFGGPQGMLVIEEIIDRIARRLGLPPEIVRERNLYRGSGKSNTTHYGQEIGDNRIPAIWHELKQRSEFAKRREKIAAWNQKHPYRKRGIAMTPVKFGISFTVTHLNQAGALVLMYQDGSAQINHGGTEMGQGVHTNVKAIAAKELGIAPDRIRIMTTSTDKVPNTSATAASSSTDLNGAAVKNACQTIRARLIPIAVNLLAAKVGNTPASDDLVFADDQVFLRERPKIAIPLKQVTEAAYLDRISLSATGYYRTPDIHWDRANGRGRPFHYFAYGAAVSEVEVDRFTGMMQVLRTDILQDVGDSINEGVNRGQVEGGFVQGMGWLTCEELKWDDQGRLLTHSPDTYKIPAFGDRPRIFNVEFLQRAAQLNVIHGSKAVGEPPLMLAISVREAIRDAVAAFGSPGGEVALPSPATCEAIFMAIRQRLEINGSITPVPSAPSERLRPVSRKRVPRASR